MPTNSYTGPRLIHEVDVLWSEEKKGRVNSNSRIISTDEDPS